MRGIGPDDAVAAHPDRPRVLAALKANAEALAAEGAVGLSTSCGFLALYQKELEALSPVPVATSALLLIKELTGRKVGVLTASAENLTPAHLEAVGAPGDTPVEGLPRDGAFAATFLRNGLTLDRDAVEREAVQAGRSLIARHPLSTHSFSNARICRPTSRRCSRRWACRSSMSSTSCATFGSGWADGH